MNISSAHLCSIIAFSLWGLFPIYWKIFTEVAAWDLFGHRLIWSFITLWAVIIFRKKADLLKEIWRSPSKRLLLALSAGLISANWLLYIYAINTGRILEASMGYFLNPLFNVLMGSVILRERLRPTQWPSIALALVAMVLIGIQSDFDHIPWLALILSVTFALYGLIRKIVHVGPIEGLTFETSIVIVPTLVAWYFQSTTPLTAYAMLPEWKSIVLCLAGVVTSLPLVLFAYGSRHLKMSTLGFIQYLSPSLKFVCGLFIFGEPLSESRLQAFYLIWIALIWYTIESFWAVRKSRKQK